MATFAVSDNLLTVSDELPTPAPFALWGYHVDDTTSPDTIIKTNYSDRGQYLSDIGSGTQADVNVKYGPKTVEGVTGWSDGSLIVLNNQGPSGLYELTAIDFENDAVVTIDIETDRTPSGGSYTATHCVWSRDFEDSYLVQDEIRWIEIQYDPNAGVSGQVTFNLMIVNFESGQTLSAPVVDATKVLDRDSGDFDGAEGPVDIPLRYRGNVWIAYGFESPLRINWKGVEEWNSVPQLTELTGNSVGGPTAFDRTTGATNDWGANWPGGSDLAAWGFANDEDEAYWHPGGTSDPVALQLSDDVVANAPSDSWPASAPHRLDSASSPPVETVGSIHELDFYVSGSGVIVYYLRWQDPAARHGVPARIIIATVDGSDHITLELTERAPSADHAKLPFYVATPALPP